MIAGPLSDRFGRRTILFGAAILLRDLRHRVRTGAVVRRARGRADDRRLRCWRLAHHRAALHRRDRAAGVARPDGVVQPAEHRDRHHGGLLYQLPDPSAGGLPRGSGGVARRGPRGAGCWVWRRCRPSSTSSVCSSCRRARAGCSCRAARTRRFPSCRWPSATWRRCRRWTRSSRRWRATRKRTRAA